MVTLKQRNGMFFRPRLKKLQDMQAEIFRQLQLLMPDQVAHYDSFSSNVAGSPLLRMDILERHRYTQFLRLTYQFNAGERPNNTPDAHIRMYQDARLAEVTSFDPEQGFRRMASPLYPHQQVFQRTWRQNLALDKWLGYLLHQGHSIVTMKPTTERISGKPSVPIPVTVG